MADKFRDLPPSSLGLLSTLLELDPAARGTAALALQSNFFSTPPLPCNLSALPVVYKEEVEDPAATHDGRKPKLRQRSQKRKDSRQKAEEQQADEVLKINSGSPDKQEEKVITESAKSGHELDGTVISAGANASSSSIQEPSENTIVNASSITVTKRFSVSPVQVLLPQDQQQLRRANSHRHSDSDDDHEDQQPLLAPDDDQADGEPSESGGGGVIVSHSLQSRPAPASMSDFDAAAVALRGSGELPAKQYVLVDHV
uniref:Protein kinase domain-containing protein n=1 Tax=Arundo donax TaxID=35708 RepID=A0A0A9ACE6_ARUDO